MNAETTSAKCRCQNCDGHIEFDPSAAGQSATCPHCGMDTVLYVPGTSAGSPRAMAWYRNLIVIRIGLGAVGFVLLVVVMVLVANSDAAQKAAINAGVGLVGVSLAALAGIIVLLTIILWIFFPVFMYFGLQRVEKVLDQIERNTRNR